MFLMDIVLQFAPPESLLNKVRTFNALLGVAACVALVVALKRKKIVPDTASLSLGWMALFLLCLVGSYGSLEVAYLDTNFRTPMVTVALIWVVAAAFVPKRKAAESGVK